MRVWILILFSSGLVAQTLPTAIVDNNVRYPNGAPFTGKIIATPTVVMPAGVTLGPGSSTLNVTAGRLSATLYPGFYNVAYQASNLVTRTATWGVPITGPVTIGQIESGAKIVPIYPFTYALISGLNTGDLLIGAPTGAATLPIGSTGQVLTVASGLPSWTNAHVNWGQIGGTLSIQSDLSSALASKQAALGYTPENVANKGAANGYAGLDAQGNVAVGATCPIGAPPGSVCVAGKVMSGTSSIDPVTGFGGPVPRDGLIAEWDLTGLSPSQITVADSSGNGRTLTLGSGVASPSVAPTGLVFKGGTTSTSAPAISFPAITVLAVVYPGSTTNPDVNYGRTIFWSSAASDGVRLYQAANSSLYRWVYAWSGGNPQYRDAATSPLGNAWQTIVAEHDGLDESIYINGGLDQYYQNPVSIPATIGPTYVGNSAAGNQPWIGQIAYVAVFNRALGAAEIAAWHTYLRALLSPSGVTLPVANAPTPLSYDGLSPTPPMGWANWTHFADNVTDQIVRDSADGLVSSGLAAAGYGLVEVDEWNASRAGGVLVPDATKFPNGMASLGNYVHGLGLTYGIYSDGGTLTCAGFAGSQGYESVDAATFASWGADYIRYDSCNIANPISQTAVQFGTMGHAIRAQSRPMLFAGGPAGLYHSAEWFAATGVDSSRVFADLASTWTTVKTTFDQDWSIRSHGGVGHWLDLDYLMCGVNYGAGGLTDDECRSQMALWSLLASPLIIGSDVRANQIAATPLATLKNAAVIAVDQDAAGVVGWKASSAVCGATTCEVWVKPLSGGAWAVGLFNRDSQARGIVATFAGWGIAGSWTGTNLFTGASLGTRTTNVTDGSVPAHGVTLVKLTPQ